MSEVKLWKPKHGNGTIIVLSHRVVNPGWPGPFKPGLPLARQKQAGPPRPARNNGLQNAARPVWHWPAWPTGQPAKCKFRNSTINDKQSKFRMQIETQQLRFNNPN